jgi:3-isopropylmalate dehydrogenase
VEVVAEGRRVLEAVARAHGHLFEFDEQALGGVSIDRYGTPLTAEALAACQAADAILLGAVGAQKYDDPTSKVRPEQGLLALRKGLGVFTNLRPVKVHPALVDASPLKPERLDGVDLLVLRELTGGLYFGRKTREEIPGGHIKVTDALEYHDYEIRQDVTEHVLGDHDIESRGIGDQLHRRRVDQHVMAPGSPVLSV